jgi:molybdate transport system substrate-binding protein
MIRLLATNSWRSVLAELVPAFQDASGLPVAIDYDPAKVMLERIRNGETGDAAILGTSAMDELVKLGRIAAGSCIVLARCGVGVAVRTGSARPDIRSVEALKRTLLAARSVAHTSAGASGMHFALLMERLGIAGEIRARARTQPGGLVGELVARGEAEIAVQQIPELKAVPGIELVGPLPAEVQLVTESAAGVFADARQAGAARELIEFLRTPDAARVMEARGLEPVAMERPGS